MTTKMLTKTLAVSLIAAAVLAGCSSTSGPAFNISEIQTSDGQKAFRAECYGLFENGSACMTAAQKMCGDQKVNVLQTLAGTKTPSDPRNVIFNCVTPPQPVVATPEPAPAKAPAVVPRKISLDEKTNFAFDSAALTPKARSILDKLVADSKGANFASVTVEGYTDSMGPDAYNLGLSQRRAQAVLDYLKGHGLSAENFAMKGFGKANPIASNATSVGRAENRRVEVMLTP
ncbi:MULTISPECIES: OmpA family protein [Caballeronia]|jgi:outer membrane protein OmpA-like peptidoglycan-associated protein|nr:MULTISPECIES: OmpA family protein [Caballeronia]EKS67024.1 putative outer membrane protein A precursor [Burkholderia sp. SJ98]MCG7404259.1 OmpA family protein [Caballeronia zhejiangensis]